MTSTPDYSIPEVIGMKFETLEKKIDDNHTETLDKIGESDRRNHDKQLEMTSLITEVLAQTKKTNGRVNKLEGWRIGIVMCCSIIIIVVLPLLAVIYHDITARLDRQAAAISNKANK